MRNIYKLKQVFILIAISISMLFSIVAEAQENHRDFNSPAYKMAIDNITTLSGGEINADNINAYLNGTLPNGGRSTDADEYITVSPVIDIVSWNGDEDAVFTVTGYPANKDLVITENDISLISTWTVFQSVSISANIATITINVEENTDNEESRSAELTIGATVGGTAVQDITSYIIQDGQPFLYVVPEFKTAGSAAGNSGPFNIIHNVSGWTYDPNTIPTDWINNVIVNNNENTFSLSFSENNDTTSRTATIKIHQQGDENVHDELTIIQAGSSPFIRVLPEFTEALPDGGTTEEFDIVSFNLNKNWEVDPGTVPAEWITDYNEDYTNNTLDFDIASNIDNSASRVAIITVREKDNHDVNDQLTIIQGGNAKDINVIPEFQTISDTGGTTGVFNVVGFNISGWEVDDTTVPTDWIPNYTEDFNNNTVTFNITENTGDTYRETDITIRDTDQEVSAQLTIVQGTESQPFIMVTPDIQSVDYAGGTTEQFNIINYNLEGWEVIDGSFQDDWISIENENNAGNYVTFTVEANSTQQLRSDTIEIQETGNPLVKDSLIIFQGPDIQPFIFTTPGFQTVTYESGTSQHVNVINFNIEGWSLKMFEMDTVYWITPNTQPNDKILFDFEENTTGAFRMAQFMVYATDNIGIYDTVTIYQDANPLPEILTAPRERFVGHLGNDAVEFKVTAVNTDGNWLVDENATQGWVNNFSYNYNDSTFSFNVDRNTTLHTRTDSIIIYANYTPTDSIIYDTVAVHQYSGLDSYLLTEPRERSIGYPEETIEFKITAVNIDDVWLVDENTVKQDWISYEYNYLDSLLVLTIDTNFTNQTRRDSITIYAIANGTTITDTISIYQYAGPDPYLLAAPRELTVSHLGKNNVDFDITVVNIPANGWEVDVATVQDWITVDTEGNDLLRLIVSNNDSLETRIDTIWFHSKTDFSVYDSVFIYQYSELDSFLIAAPREQQVPYVGDTIDFEITAVNLPGGWEIDTSTVQLDWISIDSTANDLLRLDISENDLLDTRIDTIRIFATDHDSVEDIILVYQYARPDPFLIAGPREHRVSHLGDSTLTYEITVVNVPGGWFMPDTTRQNWIEYVTVTGGDSLILNVLENKTLKTRIDTLWYFANEDHSVYDSIFVYQYSALDTFLLAAPREQTALYSGDSLVFDITTANVPGGWEFREDTTSWIINRTNINDQDSLLSLTITENPFFETRQATVYYQAIGYPNVYDSVTVFQYAQPTPYLLAHPREQTAKHIVDTLDFVILPVNLGDSGWTADTTTFKEWVSFDEEASNDTLLVLNIEPNDLLVTRVDTVTIYAIDPAGDGDVTDQVIIYQYSGLDEYLLAEPREWEVLAEGENDIIFTITPVNLGAAGWQILDESVAEWVTAEISGDTLLLDVLRNLSTETQSNTITIYSPVYEGVKDSVTVYQFAGGSSFILAHPRERKISHFGEQDVEFQVTSVNNENWTFDPLTLNDWMIDSPQKDDNTFRFNVVRNDSLTTQINKIILHATDSLEIKDTVVVYQYSSLDAYILASPREQFVSIYRDTAVFDILAVNLDTDWDVDTSSVGNWVHSSWKDPLGTKLLIDVEVNTTAFDRKDYIRITGQYNNSTIVDSILLIQEAPSLIFNPYALDMIPALKEGTADTILPVYTFSNFAEYVVFKQDPTEDWYSISSKNNTPAADTISLSYNDTLFIKVELNPSSFSHRQAFLRFRSPAPDLRIDKSYYIHQNEADREEYNLSGTISLEGNPDSSLQGIKVIVGEEDTITDILGKYSMSVLKGWRGSVTPVVDKYFFYPESVPIDRPVDGPKTVNFEAYEIKPQLAFTLDSTSICIGETLKSNEINRYPNALITGTYQLDIKYKWSSIPNDTALARQDTLLNPEFKPIVNTIYQLIITNQGLSDTARFKLIVRPRPQVTEFYGLTPDTVCRNQAGAIYLADIDSTSAEHFHWRLHDGGGTFDTLSNSNIAIVNWGNEPGSYGLTLKSHNEHGCSATDSVVRVITVSDQEAPPQTTVQWKNPDNMLYCTDPLVDHCIWGWFEMDGTNLIEEPYIIPDKNDWYVRLPDNHEFNPLKNHYFVITFYDSLSCGSLTFYNPPLDIPEHNDGNISVFPNPTDGLINIRFNKLSGSQSGKLQLYNIAGQMIYHEDLNQVRNNSTITVRDVSYPEAGIYILRIRTEDYFFNTKIVVR